MGSMLGEGCEVVIQDGCGFGHRRRHQALVLVLVHVRVDHAECVVDAPTLLKRDPEVGRVVEAARDFADGEVALAIAAGAPGKKGGFQTVGQLEELQTALRSASTSGILTMKAMSIPRLQRMFRPVRVQASLYM